MIRLNERPADKLRPIKITRNVNRYAEGSVLVEFGYTKVLCTASLEGKVPQFLRDSGSGWLTAEYSMLPRSTHTRSKRDGRNGKVSGRTQEIQRLIGRSLRAVTNLHGLGEHTIMIDCDVLQADGGTRTAAITGAYVALKDTVDYMLKMGLINKNPLHSQLAAVSVGMVSGELLLDLNYDEDSTAQIDMNVVMTADGKIVEIQCTAEDKPFAKETLDNLYSLAAKGINSLCKYQTEAPQA